MAKLSEILTAMGETYRELCGFDPDSASDIGIRLRVLASQLDELYTAVEQVRTEAFPQTSTGIYLDRHAAMRGFFRKPALAAEGVLRFRRTVASTSDIPIAVGTVCATRADPQVQFQTTVAGTLVAGQLSVDIPAKAVEPGAQGNVAVGSVCLMVNSAPGITSVTNPQAFAGGVDAEEDEALRARLLQGYRNINNGGNRAFYYETAMEDDGVSSANVLPRVRGRGTVDVVIAGPTGTETATVERLQAVFDKIREINVDVLVRRAQKSYLTISADFEPEEGYDAAKVRNNCVAAIKEYLAGFGVGKPLMVAHLTRMLLGVEGVANCRVVVPASDHAPNPDGLVACGSVTVTAREVE